MFNRKDQNLTCERNSFLIDGIFCLIGSLNIPLLCILRPHSQDTIFIFWGTCIYAPVTGNSADPDEILQYL